MTQPVVHSTLFLMFLVLILFAIRELSHAGKGGLVNLMKKASSTQIPLKQFLKTRKKPANGHLLFTEEPIYSISHKFRGRFDAAILHWEDVPVLDTLIERKFPMGNPPSRPRRPDMFQAELYALALNDSGVSTSSTRIVVIYCNQGAAMKCQQNGSMGSCVQCKNSAVYSQSFSLKRTLKELEKLRGYWFEQKEPRASPSPSKCRACPFGDKELCALSKA